MRVVVTGASGFVGRALCRRLLADGHAVVAAVRRPGSAPAGTVERPIGDLTQTVDWADALAGADAIAHLAARVHVLRERARDPVAAFTAVNVDATARLGAAARAAGIRRLVFLSSVKVLGAATAGRPFRDDDPPAPADDYGRSKRDGEAALAAIPGLEVAILRPPLVYGPGATGNLRTLARLVWQGIPLPVAGISNRRSLIGVTNLADAIVRCLDRPEAVGRRLVVADCHLSTEALVRALAQAAGRRPRLLRPPPAVFGLLRALGAGGLADRIAGSLEVEPAALPAMGWRPACPPAQEFAALMAALQQPPVVGSPRP